MAREPTVTPSPAAPRSLAFDARGLPYLREDAADGTALPSALVAAFDRDPAEGTLWLAGAGLRHSVPAPLAWLREFAALFVSQLGALPELESARAGFALPAPAAEIARAAESAPPAPGAENVSPDALAGLWDLLASNARAALGAKGAPSPGEWLRALDPVWHTVGRVCFHLAENKRDPEYPFAFMATYAARAAGDARVKHVPLARALEEYRGDRARLVALLEPVERAAQASGFVRELVDTGDVYRAQAWGPREAHALLRDALALEAAGVQLRLPDWWNPRKPARPAVEVRVGKGAPSGLGLDALLDFEISVALDGEPLSKKDLAALLAADEPLVSLRGRWVAVDKEKLEATLAHWKRAQQAARDGVSFGEAMRMIAGAGGLGGEGDTAMEGAGKAGAAAAAEWSTVTAGPWLRERLAALRAPAGDPIEELAGSLRATLRPYQSAGVRWLRTLHALRLGACLADDMGLGKTVQVIALWLDVARRGGGPHLLVAPASLVANWVAEIARFAPSLRAHVAHAASGGKEALEQPADGAVDVVITTYATLPKLAWASERAWDTAVLDEAQAIKNAGTRQSRAVKQLRAKARVALTGTPVENRLGDLWSLFDYLNPGLLGGARAFGAAVKAMEKNPAGYAPLRRLVSPYLLRRLKTDRAVIADLPDKTEMRAYCGLAPAQAELYARTVDALAKELRGREGIERRGVVLAYLTRFKQVCNHPSHWRGDGGFEPAESGKFRRLAELCEPIAARGERALVFTQFREMVEPLARYLAGLFGRGGLVLHGGTPVKQRAQLVAKFQSESHDAPPFMVLSLKAGGTGLNLTAASHVIHFDRWWNPAVEDQATDRAFRIGQKRAVMVHKLVCRGTIEEKLDAMLLAKKGLAAQVVGGADEVPLSELSDAALLELVSLDLAAALDTE